MAEKKETATKKANKKDAKQKATLPPSGFKVAVREILRSKSACTALIIIILILLFTFGGSLFLNRAQVTEMNIADAYYGWGEAGHLLGTDDGGRDIMKLLMMGGRNSIMIGISVTLITEIVGLIVGLVSGYYGGAIDSVIMRIVDFVQILPQLPIIIVLTTVIRNYNAVTLVFLIAMFGWTTTARYYRSLILSQRDRDYVLASKTDRKSVV